jgi:hypothetical protein
MKCSGSGGGRIKKRLLNILFTTRYFVKTPLINLFA